VLIDFQWKINLYNKYNNIVYYVTLLFNCKNIKNLSMIDINYNKNKENSVIIKLLKKYNRYNEGNFNDI